MNDPNPLPPIASPFGGGTPLQPAPQGPKDWANAPKIVRGWAYPLTWLAIIVFPFLIAMSFLNDEPVAERAISGIIYLIFFGVVIWLNRGIKKGTHAAWVGQICFSAFGLLGFPLGTAIHAYILSQWFKPETKAWFGQS